MLLHIYFLETQKELLRKLAKGQQFLDNLALETIQYSYANEEGHVEEGLRFLLGVAALLTERQNDTEGGKLLLNGE